MTAIMIRDLPEDHPGYSTRSFELMDKALVKKFKSWCIHNNWNLPSYSKGNVTWEHRTTDGPTLTALLKGHKFLPPVDKVAA